MDKDAVISNPDLPSIYEVPLLFENEDLDLLVLNRLGLEAGPRHMDEWHTMVENRRHPERKVRLVLAGKYVELSDAYLSIVESLNHAEFYHRTKIDLIRVDAEKLEQSSQEELEDVFAGASGILVPGGFGITWNRR